MGWPEPIYAHVPLIHGADGAKLSKRHGALGVDAYRDELGLLPEAVFNYLLRLGWGHGDDEIISRDAGDRMVRSRRMSASRPSRFDFKKLENLNGHYIREADDARLAELVAPRLGLDGRDRRTCLLRAMPELKARAPRLSIELADGAAFLFAAAPAGAGRGGGGAARRRRRARLLHAVHEALAAVDDWTTEALGAGGSRGCRDARRQARQAGAAAARRA